MRAWKVVVLVNLALALGLGWGWIWWGQQARRLTGELEVTRAAAAGGGGEREFQATGVVRAGLAEAGILVVTHGDIPGYMPSMTMGFRVATPKILETVKPGDEVRFTLRGTPPNLAITAIDKTAP
jgi:Cu/Ag efflux protein CusF